MIPRIERAFPLMFPAACLEEWSSLNDAYFLSLRCTKAIMSIATTATRISRGLPRNWLVGDAADVADPSEARTWLINVDSAMKKIKDTISFFMRWPSLVLGYANVLYLEVPFG
jgi:hypothetical protein